MVSDAPGEYRARIAARQATRRSLDQADARFAFARLGVFALALATGVLLWRGTLAAWWLVVPVAAFLWLMQRHERVIRARAEADRAIAFYERGLARLEDRWHGGGESGDRFRDDRHVYANDLDLFGTGSLFELLSLARTRTGEATLARYLTSPAAANEIRARQEAVGELAGALDLREQLSVAGADLRGVQSDRLLAWAEAPLPPWRMLAVTTWTLTAGLAAAVAILWATTVWWPLAVVLALQFLAGRALHAPMHAILSGRDPGTTADFVADALTSRSRDLDVLGGLLGVLERQRFDGDRLRVLHGRLADGAMAASRIIRRLRRHAEFHDSDRNGAVVPLGLFLFGQFELALAAASLLQLSRPHVTLGVARWRQRFGGRVRAWIEVVGEFEALTSLSAYRYEHAGDPFPEISDAAEALFDGVQLGHPLLPAARAVRNDVRLGGETRLLVISGSNMSGKSTLLRTVGVNVVLALAGAPVRAASLRLTAVTLGATLRIQDSLLEGRSRFYAEITRIREISDLADGPVPLLFLLDELFHGTNSHDRVAGAGGVLRSLLDRGAIGLVTTHDLAVTAVAGALAPRARNVHFRDWFEAGEMRFDYAMKPGPVTHSNALALMRAVGLHVDEERP